MDRYFKGSLVPLPAIYRDVGDFFVHATPARAVVATDLSFAPWVAALSGRRSMVSGGLYPPPDYPSRMKDLEVIVASGDPAAVRARAAAWGVTHVVLTPELLGYYALSRPAVESRAHFRRVHTWENEAGAFAVVLEIVRDR
jgi:hypothetical protein